MDVATCFSKYVSAYVFIPEETARVHLLEDIDKVVKAGVKLSQLVRTEIMGLRPVGLPVMTEYDAFEPLKQATVRYVEGVRSDVKYNMSYGFDKAKG